MPLQLINTVSNIPMKSMSNLFEWGFWNSRPLVHFLYGNVIIARWILNGAYANWFEKDKIPHCNLYQYFSNNVTSGVPF